MMVVSIIYNILRFIFITCILPLAIIFLIIVIVKFIYEYSKYGNKVFSAFKTKNISSAREELLLISLEKISWYKKIIKSNDFKSSYIVVDNNGINIFMIFTEVGLFKGTNDSKYLYYKTKGRDARIKNPLLSLNHDEELLRKNNINEKINKYLVITDGTLLSCDTDTKILLFSNIPYGLPNPNNDDSKLVDKLETKIINVSKNV